MVITHRADIEDRDDIQQEDGPDGARAHCKRGGQRKRRCSEVPRASSGEKKRTPSSVGPNSEVLARMAKATPGPFEK